MKSRKFQLKNGLKVLAIESQKSPVVSVQVWVRTGSADEIKGEEGVSHFIEHLLFKGTEKYKVGEIAALVEGCGGEINAYTSFDQTVFYITISKNYMSTAMDCLSQMLGAPLFDQVEIDNEREVVIEEIKRGEDNPHRQASRLLFSTVYKKHPYGVPVIGYTKIIQAISRKRIKQYFDKRYSAKNMTLLIVGDFQMESIKAEANKFFGSLSDEKPKKVVRKIEPKQIKERIKVYHGTFEENLMHLAWPVPSATHKDVAALDVMAMILGQGESSRLMQGLRIKNNFTKYSTSSTFTPKDKGFFAISTALIAEKLDVALDELNRQLELFLSEPPSQEELSKVIVNLESDEYYSIQTVDGLARKFGAYEDLFNDFTYYKKFLKMVNELKPEDITKAARKYLKPDMLTVAVMTSMDEAEIKIPIKKFMSVYKKQFTKAKSKKLAGGSRKKIKSMKWKPNAEATKTFKKHELKSGASVVAISNFDTPVISLKAAFLGGIRVEPEELPGLTELLSRAWVSQTKQMTEQQLHERLDGEASSISAFGGRNTAGLSLTTLSPVAKSTLRLYNDVLNDFEITKEIVEREKEQMLEEIKSRADSPAQLCMRQFLQRMFGQHPYAIDPLGTVDSINQINNKDVEVHLSKMRMAKNLNIVVAGDVDAKEWVSELEGITSRLPKGERVTNKFEFSPPASLSQDFLEAQKEQTHIVFGFPGLTFTDKRRYALQVIQSVLAGQGGRLFLELRDKESLAYTVSPLRMEGLDAGYFGAYIACSPEKAKKALDMIKVEFDKLCSSKVKGDELGRAKKYLIGRHDIDLQKTSAIATSILFDDIYGLPYNETYDFAKKIAEVNSDEVNEVANSLFSKNAVISVVGKTCPW